MGIDPIGALSGAWVSAATAKEPKHFQESTTELWNQALQLFGLGTVARHGRTQCEGRVEMSLSGFEWLAHGIGPTTCRWLPLQY
jgi:hypothetical protein